MDVHIFFKTVFWLLLIRYRESAQDEKLKRNLFCIFFFSTSTYFLFYERNYVKFNIGFSLVDWTTTTKITVRGYFYDFWNLSFYFCISCKNILNKVWLENMKKIKIISEFEKNDRSIFNSIEMEWFKKKTQ